MLTRTQITIFVRPNHRRTPAHGCHKAIETRNVGTVEPTNNKLRIIMAALVARMYVNLFQRTRHAEPPTRPATLQRPQQETVAQPRNGVRPAEPAQRANWQRWWRVTFNRQQALVMGSHHHRSNKPCMRRRVTKRKRKNKRRTNLGTNCRIAQLACGLPVRLSVARLLGTAAAGITAAEPRTGGEMAAPSTSLPEHHEPQNQLPRPPESCSSFSSSSVRLPVAH